MIDNKIALEAAALWSSSRVNSAFKARKIEAGWLRLTDFERAPVESGDGFKKRECGSARRAWRVGLG